MRAAVVEVLSQCPTYFGRKQARRRRTDDGAVPRPYGSSGLPEAGGNPTLVPRGILRMSDQPEYCARYASIIASQHQE